MQSFVAGRLACVDLPGFALQLLLRRYPQWRGLPVAVVSGETPQGEVLIPSREAQKKGVLIGLSFAAALGLAPELRSAAVSQAEIDDGKELVLAQLRRFSPEVQAHGGTFGAFWLNASGLDRLYPSLQMWGDEIREALQGLGFKAAVVAGFSRFGTLALAREGRWTTMVLTEPQEEFVQAQSVSLNRLALPPSTLEELLKLGKRTVGDLLQLPAAGLLERYGPEVYELRRLAAGQLWDPLLPADHEDPLALCLVLDAPESDAARVIFLTKGLLGRFLAEVAGRHRAVSQLEMTLQLHGGKGVAESLRPAQPTLDERQLIDLVRLRLEKLCLTEGVTEIRLDGRTVPAAAEQLQLFAGRQRRDLKAADRVFARLRAEFGPGAVARLKICPGHLPEAKFSFEPLEHARFPRPPRRGYLPLARRIFARPMPFKGPALQKERDGGKPVMAGQSPVKW